MLFFTSGLNTFLATFLLIATLKTRVVRALRSVAPLTLWGRKHGRKVQGKGRNGSFG